MCYYVSVDFYRRNNIYCIEEYHTDQVLRSGENSILLQKHSIKI